MPEYEIEVDGPIGPVVAWALQDFTAVATPTVTVLDGTLASAEDLSRVVDLLTARGFAPLELSIEPRDRADDPILAGHRCTITGLPGDDL